MDGVLLREANQTLPFAHRMVVLRLPSRPTFRYFGWQSLEARLAAADGLDPRQKAEWSSDFDGLSRRQHPQRIALALGGEEAVFFIPERADVSFRRFIGPE